MAKASGFTDQHHFILTVAFWHTTVCTMHASWTYVPVTSFVFHLSLQTVQGVDLR